MLTGHHGLNARKGKVIIKSFNEAAIQSCVPDPSAASMGPANYYPVPKSTRCVFLSLTLHLLQLARGLLAAIQLARLPCQQLGQIVLTATLRPSQPPVAAVQLTVSPAPQCDSKPSGGHLKAVNLNPTFCYPVTQSNRCSESASACVFQHLTSAHQADDAPVPGHAGTIPVSICHHLWCVSLSDCASTANPLPVQENSDSDSCCFSDHWPKADPSSQTQGWSHWSW